MPAIQGRLTTAIALVAVALRALLACSLHGGDCSFYRRCVAAIRATSS